MSRPDTRWTALAACAGKTDVFFPPDNGGRPSYKPAKEVCSDCPVIVPCRNYALTVVAAGVQLHGCWGGTDEVDRKELLGRIRVEPDHGTDRGYKQHKRRGEDACGPCMRAHRATQQAYAEAARAAS